MAKGLFAPGHLGEVTQIVTFGMVDAALAETGAVQQRLRRIPARVVVYLAHKSLEVGRRTDKATLSTSIFTPTTSP
ncbi:transposase domain-containing protein [Streptomyces sp. NPDC002677]|uniref:transposase domain-containing protein n=1 Tax=Streptomyces sp. NPDC002677 TaxID=3154774 RepID=UPI00332D15F2